MIKLMWKYIQFVESDYDKYMSENDVNTLLLLMETAGMIPPLEPDRRVEDCDLGLPEWEPEDE
jgi:hypothetical protein